jgi:hypothetical protein
MYKIEKAPTPEQVEQELEDWSDAALERLAAKVDYAIIGRTHWEGLEHEQRQAMRAGNLLAKRKRDKQRAEAKAADDAKVQARIDAENTAKIDAYRQQVRGAWIGDDTSFDEAWPTLLQQWRIDQARAAVNSTLASVRARMMTDF